MPRPERVFTRTRWLNRVCGHQLKEAVRRYILYQETYFIHVGGQHHAGADPAVGAKQAAGTIGRKFSISFKFLSHQASHFILMPRNTVGL